MQLTRDTLKPFQLRAADALALMLAAYPNADYPMRVDPDTQEPYPFLCRLKAITGSGKTPMLAALAALLGDAIILWTTNRGAVISQTATKLNAGGDYAPLLPEDAQIKVLGELTETDWNDVVEATSGLTILLGTVALFNRADDSKEALNIHKDRGGSSYWEMLAGRGPQRRHRPLFVVYDEAHGTTTAQFTRLAELRPHAFVLASSSPLPADLVDWIPGKTPEAKEVALLKQTVLVPTPEVVEAGLLKTRLYLVDCNTTRRDAIKEANDQWLRLRAKVTEPTGPIWCGVVNKTLSGLEVWEVLTQELGVNPDRIAVHLSGVEKALADANPNVNWGPMHDTHKAKKTPEMLRAEGYTHLIWNLSLREGWDEPWAYVAYLDETGKSSTDIHQKIGRFLRQPNATPSADGDLNSAYFYFNVPDEAFTKLVKDTQHELENEGYEVLLISGSGSRPGASRQVPVKTPTAIVRLAESFGEELDTLENLDKILLDEVVEYTAEDRRAPGKVKTKVIDMRRNQEDGNLEREEARDDNAEVRVWKYLFDRLAAFDSRIIGRNGSCFSSEVKEYKPMKQKLQYGSKAMAQLNSRMKTVQQRLNAEYRLVREYDKEYEVGPFNLVTPDLKTDDAAKREKYRVRPYAHALHAEYNGMNPFEVEVAQALDGLGQPWCRNPVRGYGIPIAELGAGTTVFYPDFLLWGKKCLWAIDPKGAHLLGDAIYKKLLDVSDIEDLPTKIRTALITEGHYTLGAGDRPNKQGKDGCTLIWKEGGRVRDKHFPSPQALVKSLV